LPFDTPVKAYQLFQAVSPELATGIFQSLRDDHKEIYKSSLMSLAAQKRLRPVFIQRKSVDQQIAWMVSTAKLKASDSVAENLLQVWLLKTQKDMLTQFLDGLGVEHDEDGMVEDLPETLDAKKLKSAVDGLLKTFPAENVALYLHLFQTQQPGGWEPLTELLASDSRLQFGDAKAEAPADEEAPAKPAKSKAASAKAEDEEA